jgi:hypothetical protein
LSTNTPIELPLISQNAEKLGGKHCILVFQGAEIAAFYAAPPASIKRLAILSVVILALIRQRRKPFYSSAPLLCSLFEELRASKK